MKNRVLYFPYIRVPESKWLTQMLLYWDQVASIVPYQFIDDPDSLGPYMRSLVEEGLVLQVIPAAHMYEIPRFFEAFQEYLDVLGPELDRRKRQFADGIRFQVHVEKMGDISTALVGHRLASEAHYPWYEVEGDTANDFMSYLATSLGQLESIDSSPVTDSTDYLRRFARAGVSQDRLTQQLESLRIQILDAVLPVPDQAISPSAIRAFRDAHSPQLGDFRRRVEREIVAAAAINNPALRQRQLEIFLEEAAVQIEELQGAMRGAGWRSVRAGLSVLAAIPGVSPLLGLAGALWDALTGQAPDGASKDFAYAAYACSELSGAV